MAIIWCGGEDIDFSLLPNQYNMVTTAGHYRPQFSRYALQIINLDYLEFMQSSPFQASVTSAWMSAQIVANTGGGGYMPLLVFSNTLYSNECLGVFISAGSSQFYIGMISGNGVFRQLSNNTSYSIASNTLYRVDIQLVNYSSSGSINLYVNGTLYTTYTGNLLLPNSQNFNCLGLSGYNNGGPIQLSEIIVSTTPTFDIQGLVTVAPSGNGNIQNWLNPNWSNLANVQINDANSIYVNIPDQDTQYKLSNTWPTGDFVIDTVAIKVRDMATLNSNTGNIQAGFANIGGNLSLGNVELAPFAFTYPNEWYFSTDPTSLNGAAPWGNTNISSYQLDIRSVS